MGEDSVSITSVQLDPADSPDFEYQGASFAAGKNVTPRGAEEIELPWRLRPRWTGEHRAELVIHGGGYRAAPLSGLRICLQGNGIQGGSD